MTMIAPSQEISNHPLVPLRRLSIKDVLIGALQAFAGAPDTPVARERLANALQAYIDAEGMSL